ncbi:MAG: hypothetical protein GY696_09930, partial [Gammaproteobacteria bacterium]|nr:hypothetical protein [Gammaproteobacteria bacterium]
SGQEQELGQDIKRRKVLCGRLTGSKLKRRPATDATDGFMTMARSETAQVGVIGSVRSMYLLVVSSIMHGPIWSHTKRVLGREDGLKGRGVDSGSGIPMFDLATCTEIALDGVGLFDPEYIRQWSALPPCVPRNLQLFSETSPAFRQDPQLQLALTWDEEFGPGAGQGPHLVPHGDLDRSRFLSPIVVGDGCLFAASSYRRERPLLTLDGTRGIRKILPDSVGHSSSKVAVLDDTAYTRLKLRWKVPHSSKGISSF